MSPSGKLLGTVMTHAYNLIACYVIAQDVIAYAGNHAYTGNHAYHVSAYHVITYAGTDAYDVLAHHVSAS